MATTTTNFGWDIPQSTDLVKDGATAIATLGQDIDTALVGLKGGTTGQVLSKTSNTDLAYTWVAQDDSNAIQNAIVDAKGDLIGATAADTPARLAVGTNGQILMADSTAATGLKWATPAGGGKVLQVVSTTYATSTSIATASYADTGLSLSITPTLATSKVLVLTYQTFGTSRSTGQCGMGVQLLRGATVITTPATDMFAGGASGAASVFLNNQVSISYLDSPATTSATTYKTQGKPETTANSSTLVAQYQNTTATMILLEIGA
jgi:hypothetical protein